MLLWIAVVFWLYLTARLIRPLPIGLWRILLPVALFAILRYHSISYLLWGSIFPPEVPRILTIAVNWLYASAVLLALFHGIADLAALGAAAVRRARPRVSRWARTAASALAFLISGYAVSSAIVVPPVKKVEVAIDDLPPELDGFQFVHLTDLHISRMFDAGWVRRVVDRVMPLEPQLVLVTGAIIDGTPMRRREDVAPLAGLSAEHGVFAIAGNHEYYFRYDAWMARLAELGLRSIVNAHHVIQVDGGPSSWRASPTPSPRSTEKTLWISRGRWPVVPKRRSSSYIIARKGRRRTPSRASTCNCPGTRTAE